jgi:hypothetical protein
MKNLILLATILTLTGCEVFQQWETEKPENTSTTIVDSLREQNEQTEEIDSAASAIGEDLNTIDDHANAILDDVAIITEERNYNIDPRIDTIEGNADAIKEQVDEAQQEGVRIDEALEDLEQANNRVAAAVGQIEELEDLVKSYEESDREIRREALENLYEYLTLFFAVGFAMIVGGVFVMFWVSKKLGGTILAIGFLTIGLATASQYYMEEIAQVGLYVFVGGFLLTAIIVGFMLMNGKKNEKAIVEIVQLVESMKDKLTPKERKEIFGQDGIAYRLTSKLTKEIVSKIKIKNGWDKD